MTRGKHVLDEVREVDVAPVAEGARDGLLVGNLREPVEERVRVAERRLAQREEAAEPTTLLVDAAPPNGLLVAAAPNALPVPPSAGTQREALAKLIAQQDDGSWTYRRHGPGDAFALDPIDAKIAVDEVFADVEFE